MGVLSRVSCVTCAHAHIRARPCRPEPRVTARTHPCPLHRRAATRKNPAGATQLLRGPLFSVPGRSSGDPAVFPVPGMRKMSNPKVNIEGHLLNRPAFKRWGVWLRG